MIGVVVARHDARVCNVLDNDKYICKTLNPFRSAAETKGALVT